MNHSGDAAEQIVRMSLEGVEVAARITGTAAKEIALLLLAALKSPEKSPTNGLKLKGKARLESMLKSGKPLEIFSVKERDLKTFVQEAKRYGIVYCVLRNSKNAPDGLCDIMVKADDAPKINRLVERFKFAAVDTARIESEVVRDMTERTAEPAAPSAEAERGDADTPPIGADSTASPVAPEINDVDALLDELLGTDEGKIAPEMTEAEKAEADKADLDQAAADKAEADKPAPDMPDSEKPTPEKSEPAKPKRGRGRKKDPAPATDTPTATTSDERKEPDPLASGGQTPADSQPPKTTPSEPFSGSRKTSETRLSSKPSVKEELREITAGIKAKEADAPKREEPAAEKPKTAPPPTHKQPQNKRKSKKSKGR